MTNVQISKWLFVTPVKSVDCIMYYVQSMMREICPNHEILAHLSSHPANADTRAADAAFGQHNHTNGTMISDTNDVHHIAAAGSEVLRI